MNLIKSFNWSYLKENIKKSRGIIILLVLIVPLFTALYTVFNVNGTEEYFNIPEKEWLATIDIYGMYIIPVLLSFLLFGYVYKKNSVDLINSMPINRKSIFVTNTIIGVVLITIIQILTAIALLVCNNFLEYVHIYTGVIIDLFVVMWLSYIFVFTATNLAMTLSGTFSTQVLLTVIILMLVPFLVDSYNNFLDIEEYEFITEDKSFTAFGESEDDTTLPYKVLNRYSYYGEEYSYSIYNTVSNIKMLGLSIIYFIMGLYLFKKRKMEDCEEAFSKVGTHIFVKALTILPMMIVLNINEEGRSIIFNLCIIIFYYYIYDFIVRRKVELKTSIASLILTLVILQGSCMGVDYLKDNKEIPKIRVEDVEEIAVSSSEYYNFNYALNILDIASGSEYLLKNQELINFVFNATADTYIQNEQYEEELLRYNNNEIEYMTTYTDATRPVDVVLKLNNGKEFNTTFHISQFEFENMIKIIQNDENYKSLVLAELEKDDKLILNGKLCNKEIQDKINSEIANKINSLNKEQMFLDGNLCYLDKYYYEDHKLVYNQLCGELTPEILNICANQLNKDALYKLKNAIEENELNDFTIDLSDEPMWYGLSHKYFGFQKTKEKIMDLILQCEEFNSNESFYMIIGNVGDSGIKFFTNNVEEIDNLIQLEVDKNPEYYWEYEYELEKYYRSDWLFENYYSEENL